MCLPRSLTAASPRSRRRKLCLFRFRASTKAHPARCSSSPHKIFDFAGSPKKMRSHIPFGRLFSCQGSQRAFKSPHLLWTKGCQNTTLLPKKVFSFFYRPGMFLSLLLLVQKNHFGLKNLKTSLNFLLVGKFSECTKLFSNFTNHLHLHTSTFLMATFLRLCTKLFRSFYKTFTINPHFLIGTKNDKTATRSLYFSIGT